MNIKRKIIIDTDPGQDDAVAILMALASKELEVVGITAVAGNVPLELTEKNSRIIVELSGRKDIPVYAGCSTPLGRELVTAEEVHGKTGLDGMELTEPSIPLEDKHGVDFIIETLRENNPSTISLCPLGPLTNIAQAMIQAPDIVERIQEIILMGGAYFEVGNVTPTAEFNIYVDPEAAKKVFSSGIPITMLPLDVTHQVLTTKTRMDKVRNIGNRTGKEFANLTTFFERFDKEKYGLDGAPLHDPCVIAYLLEPEIFEGRFVNVEIETESELTRGMTVADWWDVTDRNPNALFIGKVDSDRFFELLMERLRLLP